MNSDKEEVYGPVIPSEIMSITNRQSESEIIGPSLPSVNENDSLQENNEDFFGPALPPHLLKKKQNIGDKAVEKKSHENIINSDDNDDDEDMIGPLPANSTATSTNYAQLKLEERAWKLKNDYLKKDSAIEQKREEWMIELPPAHSAASFGLVPRKFRTREGPDMSDRSSWTDTPADRERKKQEMLNKAMYEQSHKRKKEDKDRTKDKVEERKRKKEKSLLELHQEKLKEKQRKAEKETGRVERRPFDRDIDLKIGGLNQKDKKSILAKSYLLDDKFCHAKM